MIVPSELHRTGQFKRLMRRNATANEKLWSEVMFNPGHQSHQSHDGKIKQGWVHESMVV